MLPPPPQHSFQTTAKPSKSLGVDVSTCNTITNTNMSILSTCSSAQGGPGSARKGTTRAALGGKLPSQPYRETPPSPPPLPLPLYGTALYKGLFDAPHSRSIQRTHTHTLRSYSPHK